MALILNTRTSPDQELYRVYADRQVQIIDEPVRPIHDLTWYCLWADSEDDAWRKAEAKGWS